MSYPMYSSSIPTRCYFKAWAKTLPLQGASQKHKSPTKDLVHKKSNSPTLWIHQGRNMGLLRFLIQVF